VPENHVFYFVVKIHENFFYIHIFMWGTQMRYYFFMKTCGKIEKFEFSNFSLKDNNSIVSPASNGYAKILMNFDNKIKNDFRARDRTRALWVKAENLSQSDMGQTPKTPWYGTRFEALGELSRLVNFLKFWPLPAPFSSLVYHEVSNHKGTTRNNPDVIMIFFYICPLWFFDTLTPHL
jgi:hypothetical protein